jgi:hypothetical protein
MAARRIAREAAMHSFDSAAKALNEDWHTTLDRKQVQRWGEAIGQEVVEARDRAVLDAQRGERPSGPLNDPQLLVIEVDGGRVQEVQKHADTGSRWREDKVLSITSYLPGDGRDRDPQRLVTTYQATMRDTKALGAIARTESERRGIRQASMTVIIGDCGNWIDPLCREQFPSCVRIADYYHAAEHLHEAARALHGVESPEARTEGDRLAGLLYEGRIDPLLDELKAERARLGPANEGAEADPPTHPREALRKTIGYIEGNRHHMDYPSYRGRGWPIGSGVIESGVKQLGQRVKGSEKFWREEKVETILALRCLWLSEDERWSRYWMRRQERDRAA